MSLVGKIQSLFLDREKTQPIFPITKVKAVSDDNGKGLNVLLDDKASKDFVTAKIAEAQLGGGGGEIDLSGFATKDDLNAVDNKIPTTAAQIGAAPESHVVDKNNPHGVTPEQIGAVSKSGDTMTGALTTTRLYVNPGEGGYPTFEFQAGTVRSAFVQQDIRDGKRNVGFYLYQSDQDDNATKYYTCYNLPAPLTGQTANKVYDILTTRAPVSIAQGGTGATDAATARANLGVAPAWFGLGELGAYCSDCNNAMKNGWFWVDGNTANIPESGLSGVLFVESRNKTGSVDYYQTLRSGAITIERYYSSFAKAWQPWEWENPPMKLGVEYRTTERWNGKPVYTMLYNFGAMPNASTKTVIHGIQNIDYPLSASVTAKSETWAFVVPTAYNVETDIVFSLRELIIKTTTDRSEYNAYFTLKYTKD